MPGPTAPIPTFLTHYTGTVTTPGQQILVARYPQGTLAWLFNAATYGPGDSPLDNPYTTDGFGAYDFWTIAPVLLVTLTGVGVPVIGEPFTGDGSTPGFTLAHTPIAGSIAAWINGVRVTTWSVAGVVLTFTMAPGLGDEILVDYRYYPI